MSSCISTIQGVTRIVGRVVKDSRTTQKDFQDLEEVAGIYTRLRHSTHHLGYYLVQQYYYY